MAFGLPLATVADGYPCSPSSSYSVGEINRVLHMVVLLKFTACFNHSPERAAHTGMWAEPQAVIAAK